MACNFGCFACHEGKSEHILFYKLLELKPMTKKETLNTAIFFFQTVSVGRRRFSAKFQLIFRLFKFLIFVTFVSILITLIALPHMTVLDIVVCVLAFMPTGWGLLLVSILLLTVVVLNCLCQTITYVNGICT